MAKLVGESAYTKVPFDHALERDPVYFCDLGTLLGKSYEEVAGGFVCYYTGGLVLVGELQVKTDVKLLFQFLPENLAVYGAFEGKWLRTEGETIMVQVRPGRIPNFLLVLSPPILIHSND